MNQKAREEEIAKIKRFIAGLLFITIGIHFVLINVQQPMDSQLILFFFKHNGLSEFIGSIAVLAGVCFLIASAMKIKTQSFKKRIRRGIWRT